MKKTVLLIVGGTGKEREVSLMGRDYVRSLIDSEKYRVITATVLPSGIWLTDDGKAIFPTRSPDGSGILMDGALIPIDGAFPLLHGDGGEDGIIQGSLQAAGIPFVGADTYTGALCADKWYTKCVATALGIPVSEGIYLTGAADMPRERERAERSLTYPMFVKPARLGSSIGACPIPTGEEFYPALRHASEAADRLLIERAWVKKRELEVAYFSTCGETIITDAGEILEEGFYDYDGKYGGSCITLDRATLSPEVAALIRDYSERLATAVGLRHLGRIDFFLTEDGVIFNEINTMPGFTQSSLYPRLVARAGIEPRELINRLLDDAIEEGTV